MSCSVIVTIVLHFYNKNNNSIRASIVYNIIFCGAIKEFMICNVSMGYRINHKLQDDG